MSRRRDQRIRPSRSGKRASMKPRTAMARRQQVYVVGRGGRAPGHRRRHVRIHSLPRGGAAPGRGRRTAASRLRNHRRCPPDRQRRRGTKRDRIGQGLEDAKAAMGQGNYAGALQQADRVLELDSDNQDALDLKRQAESALRAQYEGSDRYATTSVPPAEPETPGIPRRPAKRCRLPRSRTANRRQSEGGPKRARETGFRRRARPLSTGRPGPEGLSKIEALIADTVAKQRAAFDAAMDSGRQNEEAKQLRAARQWYQRAESIDPNADQCPRERRPADEPHGAGGDHVSSMRASFEAKSGGPESSQKNLSRGPGDDAARG